ncbi:MAG: aldose epimerase family protein [Steroidobacteraceae bacterium]
MKYTVERSLLGDQPIVLLQDDAGRRVRIACHGAALIGFEVPRGARSFDIAAGYRDGAEIIARPGSRFAIMSPFAGRIADARYRFDGADYDLQPGAAPGPRESRHGFVRDADFALTELVADTGCARATLSTSVRRPPGYPFVIALSVTFTLDAAGLTLAARMRNGGGEPAPCFFGWHTYLRAGDGYADEWLLEVPARTLIRTGADLIALPGNVAYVPLSNEPALDFRRPRLIGGSVLDQEYTDLIAEADGRIRTRLTDRQSGFAITVWQERGVMHVFTGDTLGRDARRSVALEPMECMANAFNRPEWADAVRLDPGEERVYRCGVAPTA